MEKEKSISRFDSNNSVGSVDKEKGIIYGISIITVGEAAKHGVFVDETMVNQVVEKGKAKEPLGLKSRFDHPGACSRAIGTFTGRFHNFRRDGLQARADLFLAESSAISPDGNLREYILELAEEDPDAFATSIVFTNAEPFIPDQETMGQDGLPAKDDPYWYPHSRVDSLYHCDIVDEGAANKGLFGRPDYWAEQAEKWSNEHPGVIGKIIANYYESKQKKEDEKMAEKDIKEIEQELSSVVADRDMKIEELDASVKTIETLTAETEVKITEALAKGSADVFASIKDRVELFKNVDFVLDTIEMSIEDAKTKFIETKKDESDKREYSKVEGGDGGNDDAETFENKVADKIEFGLSKKDAIRKCASEFSELHQEYIKRINESR